MTAEIDIDYRLDRLPAWRGLIREGARIVHECPWGASVTKVPGRPGVFVVAALDTKPYLVHSDGSIVPIEYPTR